MRTSGLQRTLKVLNATALLGLIWLVGRPSGVVGRRFGEWREVRRSRAAITSAWDRIVTEGGTLGAAHPRLIVAEFSDYECPFCRALEPVLEAVLQRHPDVQLVYRHLPLSVHAFAEDAARASICAERKGRFGEFHRELFRDTRWESDGNFTREAMAVGLVDTAAFRRCLTDRTTGLRLGRDTTLGNRLKLTGTPVLLIRGRKIQGFIPDSALEKLIAGG
jgi:protein-disulfide isomerase